MINTINFFSQCDEDIDLNTDRLMALLDGHKEKAIHLEVGEQIFCRARKCDNDFNKSKSIKKQDLSYISDVSKVSLGRANKPHSPMFYACAGIKGQTRHEAGVCFETGAQNRQHIIAGYWGLKQTVKLVYIGHSPIFKLNALIGGITNEQQAYIESYSGRRTSFFLTELFTIIPDKVLLPETRVYGLSAAAAHIIINGTALRPDGIFYPSVKILRSDQHVDNVALTPIAVDEKLKLLWAEEIRIDRIHDEGVDITLLDSAHETNADGELVWKGHPNRSFLRLPDGKQIEVPKNYSNIES